jgi:hypothetical protein
MPKQLDNQEVNEISGGLMPSPDGGCFPEPGWPMPSPFPSPFPEPLPPSPREDFMA